MLNSTPCKHPVIVLKDIKTEDLESLLNYMYDGIVSVSQNDLARLIKAAEMLRIKGLAVPDESTTTSETKKQTNGSNIPASTPVIPTLSPRDGRGSPLPKKRRKDDAGSSLDIPSGMYLPSPTSTPPPLSQTVASSSIQTTTTSVSSSESEQSKLRAKLGNSLLDQSHVTISSRELKDTNTSIADVGTIQVSICLYFLITKFYFESN